MSKKPILIIGGGISGITAAVEIAETGHEVILIEEQPMLGGNVLKMNNYFPKFCPPTCGLEINFRRIRQNPRITCYTSTTVTEIKGEKGNFNVVLESAPLYVKNNCTACGKCTEVCPEIRPDTFNYGFGETKAIYLPHEMAYPMKYTIDENFCKKEKCSKCKDVCDYDAIDLYAGKTITRIKVSSVIVTTGWENYNATGIDNLHYSDYENVVTNIEFERLLALNGPGGKDVNRPSDKAIPKDIVFVQCAGSRDENHLPYCSAVCCSASLKHALTLQEKYTDIKVKIFYIDLRVTGRNEDFLEKAIQNKNIELIKGKVAGIEEIKDNKNLIVEAEDILSGKKIKHETQMVVLATGIVPNCKIPGISTNNNGFLTETIDGIYSAACCKKPMDVSSSVKEATAAALKAIQT